MCSYKLNRAIGAHLAKREKERGILKSAYEKNVPVFVPGVLRFRTPDSITR